jgi:hypothetical protein
MVLLDLGILACPPASSDRREAGNNKSGQAGEFVLLDGEGLDSFRFTDHDTQGGMLAALGERVFVRRLAPACLPKAASMAPTSLP